MSFHVPVEVMAGQEWQYSYVLKWKGWTEKGTLKCQVTICSSLLTTIIGSDRGENYNFSNGQEINHKA